MKVITYIRVSTEKQADSGLSIEAQRARLETECGRRGWTIVREYVEQAEHRDPKPIRDQAMLDVRSPDVDGLMVAKLDRLGRSTFQVAGIIEAAAQQGWLLVCLEPQVDMSTPYGRAMAQMACVFAELERAMIGQRTSEALRAKIARGELVGRPPAIPQDVADSIMSMHRAHVGPTNIARYLNADGVPTVTGVPWDHSTVARVIRRESRRLEQQREVEAA